MKRITLLFIATFFSATSIAQILIGVHPARVICPGSTVTYGIDNSAPDQTYTMVVTNGTINETPCLMRGNTRTVTWNSNLDQGAQIKIYKGCLTPQQILDSVPEVTENLTKVNLSSPGSVPSVSIPCGVQQLDLYFTISPDAADYKRFSYSFTANSSHISVPAGWSIISGGWYSSETQAGVTFDKYKIRVQTDASGAGNVMIRFKTYCSPASYGEWSNPTVVTRSTQPTPSLLSSTKVNLCLNETGSYTINGSSAATSYSYSVPSGFLINGASTTLTTSSNSVTVTNTTSTVNGLVGNLSVVENGACGTSEALNIPIYANKPVVTFPPNPELCEGESFVLEATIPPYYTARTWTALVSGGINQPLTELYDGAVEVPGDALWVDLAVANDCGTSNYRYRLYRVACLNASQSEDSFMVYPNPVNFELVISGKQGNEIGKTKNLPEEAKLYDNKGKLLRRVKSQQEDENLKIDTRDIPNGTYFLHIINGKRVEKKQIIIQH